MISKNQLKEYVDSGYNVSEISEMSSVNEKELFEFYINCYLEDFRSFPLEKAITKQLLAHELENSSVLQISVKYKVSVTPIKRLMNIYGLYKPTLKDVLTPEVLFACFVEQDMTDREIANKYSCSVEAVKGLKKKYGIGRRNRTEFHKPAEVDFIAEIHIKYGFSNAQIAQMVHVQPWSIFKLFSDYAELHPEFSNKAFRSTLPLYRNINSLLLEKIEPTVLFELLHDHTLTQIAEIYKIIPSGYAEYELGTEKWFKKVSRNYTTDEIIELFHLPVAVVKRLSGKYGNTSDNAKADVDIVKYLYIEKHLSSTEIAEILKLPVSAINECRRKNKVYSARQTDFSRLLPADEFFRLYVKENLTLTQISEVASCNIKAITALLKEYGKQYPEMLSQNAGGASKERVEYLKKQFRYNNAGKAETWE